VLERVFAELQKQQAIQIKIDGLSLDGTGALKKTARKQ
jgi:hypothetical protein